MRNLWGCEVIDTVCLGKGGVQLRGRPAKEQKHDDLLPRVSSVYPYPRSSGSACSVVRTKPLCYMTWLCVAIMHSLQELNMPIKPPPAPFCHQTRTSDGTWCIHAPCKDWSFFILSCLIIVRPDRAMYLAHLCYQWGPGASCTPSSLHPCTSFLAAIYLDIRHKD